MYIVYVTIETYSTKYCDRITVKAANESSARIAAERKILQRHGKELMFTQVTSISKM